jgi:flagellar basal-body rod protein FlgC
MYGALDVSTSALVAQRSRLDVIAGNIATKDAYSTDADGNAVPYRRRVALLAPQAAGGGVGVRVDSIIEDPAPFSWRFAPDDKLAWKSGPHKGYVPLSNIDYHTEMVDAMQAARAYEANITVMEAAKSIAGTTLRLIA